jgi:hypothetical protein
VSKGDAVLLLLLLDLLSSHDVKVRRLAEQLGIFLLDSVETSYGLLIYVENMMMWPRIGGKSEGAGAEDLPFVHTYR